MERPTMIGRLVGSWEERAEPGSAAGGRTSIKHPQCSARGRGAGAGAIGKTGASEQNPPGQGEGLVGAWGAEDEDPAIAPERARCSNPAASARDSTTVAA